jgi:hypothetical protein
MKKVFIIHGWDGNPDEPVLRWLRLKLEEKGYLVSAPAMPNPETPEIELWVNKLKEVIGVATENTILVGHSVGCQAVMRYLETLSDNSKVSGLLLLAPWMKLDEETIKEEGPEVVEIARPWMETPIDFEKIKNITNKITAIFSDNDPFVPLDQEEFFRNKLSAKTLVEHSKGHFSPSDDVSELPSALSAVLEF